MGALACLHFSAVTAALLLGDLGLLISKFFLLRICDNPAKDQLLLEQVLLSRYSLEEDIVVGTMHPNRDDPGLQAVLGCLTHSFAIRTDLSGALLLPRNRPMAVGQGVA